MRRTCPIRISFGWRTRTFRAVAARGRLPAGAPDDRQHARQLAHPDVHDRIRGAVRRVQSRPRGIGSPILLGGTSNHFRTAFFKAICGWDAWNVTEDADLGIRLARLGLPGGGLPSSTLEEAPSGACSMDGPADTLDERLHPDLHRTFAASGSKFGNSASGVPTGR